MKGNIKGIVIVILCITIIVLGIGFCTLSMQIEKYKTNDSSFDINFTSFKLLSSIKGGTIDPKGNLTIDKTGSILNMEFDLYSEYDEMTYEVKIKNEGTITAKIINIFASPDFKNVEVLESISPINISISEISGKVLESGDETTIKITVQYRPNKGKKDKVNLTGKLAIIAEAKS